MASNSVVMVASAQLSAADRQRRLGEAFDRLWALVPEKETAGWETLAKHTQPTATKADTREHVSRG